MSLYCIGDLHGRYDLFKMALEKINFNNETDKMYILGDVIDINYGAIKILRHIMQYPNSFELILGNHEDNFKKMEKAYDVFMLNDNIKQKVKDVMDNYFEAYDVIEDLVIIYIRKKDISSIRNLKKVIEWLKPSRKRALLLDAIINLIEYLDHDLEKFHNIIRVLSMTNGRFKTKQFVIELLEIDIEEYQLLKKYLFSKNEEIKFSYSDKQFILTHTLSYYTNCSLKHIPDMETSNQYVIFGHEPVAKIHKLISSGNWDFNFREIFSYIDRFDNHYFNLDMSTNVVAVLRLDDLEEYYVMKYKRGLKSEVRQPSIEPIKERKIGYKMVDSCLPVNKKGFSFITYKDYCMEYLIGVNKFKKIIYYKRADFLEFLYIEAIEDWYDNQSVEVIIDKVKNDYDTKKNTEQYILREKIIRGIQN